MPIITGSQPDAPSTLSLVLENILSGVTKASQLKKDQAYRESAAKMLGMDPNDLKQFQRDELKDLIKEKLKASYTPQEWKPKTMEEALKLKEAEAGLKNTSRKEYEDKLYAIGNKVAKNEKVTKAERDLWEGSGNNRTISSNLVMPDVIPGITPRNNPIVNNPQSSGSGIGELLKNILIPGKFTNTVKSNLLPAPAAPVTPVSPQDPFAVRIQELQTQGVDNDTIKNYLIEVGIDPGKYGL
jgi:hypothetical protein